MSAATTETTSISGRQHTLLELKKNETVKWAIAFLVPLIVWLIPMPFDQSIKNYLIVTAGAITCWITLVIPIEVTGFLLPCFYLLLKVARPETVFSPWSNTLVWGTVALLLIGSAAMSSGLSTRMAYGLLVKMKANVKGLVWGFSLAGIPLSFIITDSFVRAIVFVTIAAGVCKALEIEAKSKEATALIMGGFMGMAGPAIGSLPAGNGLLINAVYYSATGTYITYIQWLLHNFIPSLAWTAVSVWCLLKVLKIGNDNRFDAREELNMRYREMGTMSRREKMTLFFLLLVVVDYMGATYLGLDPLLIPVFFIPFMALPGVGVLTRNDFAEVDFGMLFVITGALCIGKAAAEVGIVDILIQQLAPLLSGSSVKMVMGAFGFTILAKFLLTPLTVIFTFMGPLVQMAEGAGLNPLPIAYTLNLVTEAYVFPYEFIILLVALSFGYADYKDSIKVLMVRAAASVLVMVLVALPLWKLLGLM